jgi:cell division protein FtsI/penicillin-binding protein 2
LGVLTGIELAGEARGTVIPPTDQDGGAVRYSNMSFGQGMDVTMVQVCAAFSTIINGGTYYAPTVIEGQMSDDGTKFEAAAAKAPKPGVVSATTSDKVRTMIHEARSAFYAGNDTAGYYIGGKTGTSQTLRDGKYIDDETVGTYLGFGGNDSSSGGPKYVIMVQVSGKNMNLAGGTDAMPIFTDISNWMLDYMKLQPKG